MSQERLKYLLQHYKAGRLTDPEREEWQALIEKDTYKSIIEADIAASMADPVPNTRWNASLQQDTWENILNARPPEKRPGGRRLWLLPVSAAAACLLAIIGIWWFKRPSPLPRTVNLAGIHRASGSNKAILTLADGNKIRLDSAANKSLAQQGHTAVKLENGVLAYYPDGGSPLREDQPSGSNKASAGGLLYNVVTTPRGGQYQVLLPDGTKVWLNAASSLRYPTAFTDGRREVELTGEAYFEASRNSSMPFRVKVNDMQVDVLGTHFNIKAYPADAERHTALLEGSVRVRNPEGDLLLKPGQEAVETAEKNGLLLREIEPDRVIAWKNNMFSFNGSSLPEVAHQLERWYDVQFRSDPGTDTVSISGYISRQETILQVLKMLEYTAGIHYSIDGRNITLHFLPRKKA